MESNKNRHSLNIVGERELLEICIYNANTLTGANIKLVDFNTEGIQIGVVEFDEGDYLAIFKLGAFHQEYRFLPKEKWVIPTGK